MVHASLRQFEDERKHLFTCTSVAAFTGITSGSIPGTLILCELADSFHLVPFPSLQFAYAVVPPKGDLRSAKR